MKLNRRLIRSGMSLIVGVSLASAAQACDECSVVLKDGVMRKLGFETERSFSEAAEKALKQWTERSNLSRKVDSGGGGFDFFGIVSAAGEGRSEEEVASTLKDYLDDRRASRASGASSTRFFRLLADKEILRTYEDIYRSRHGRQVVTIDLKGAEAAGEEGPATVSYQPQSDTDPDFVEIRQVVVTGGAPLDPIPTPLRLKKFSSFTFRVKRDGKALHIVADVAGRGAFRVSRDPVKVETPRVEPTRTSLSGVYRYNGKLVGILDPGTGPIWFVNEGLGMTNAGWLDCDRMFTRDSGEWSPALQVVVSQDRSMISFSSGPIWTRSAIEQSGRNGIYYRDGNPSSPYLVLEHAGGIAFFSPDGKRHLARSFGSILDFQESGISGKTLGTLRPDGSISIGSFVLTREAKP